MKMMALRTDLPKQIFMQTDADGNISTFDFNTDSLNSNLNINGNFSGDNINGINVTASGKVSATGNIETPKSVKIGSSFLRENDNWIRIQTDDTTDVSKWGKGFAANNLYSNNQISMGNITLTPGGNTTTNPFTISHNYSGNYTDTFLKYNNETLSLTPNNGANGIINLNANTNIPSGKKLCIGSKCITENDLANIQKLATGFGLYETNNNGGNFARYGNQYVSSAQTSGAGYINFRLV